jgi:hypothetical protein
VRRKKYTGFRSTTHTYQGDQIGRIFAQWTIVFFGPFFDNYKTSSNSLSTYFHCRSYLLILAKKGRATFWRFFHKLTWSPWYPPTYVVSFCTMQFCIHSLSSYRTILVHNLLRYQDPRLKVKFLTYVHM